MDLFTPATSTSDLPHHVPGLHLFEEVITSEQESKLLDWIDAQPWIDDLSRRVQHYGYRYDYRARSIDISSKLGDMPVMLDRLALHLESKEGALPFHPEQAIVNEYLPGQGISAHVDCEPCFGPDIASLSLGSFAMMRFQSVASRDVVDIPLPRRSLVVLTGESRTAWSHSIAARKSDQWNGQKTLRSRRVSVTFRTIILNS